MLSSFPSTSSRSADSAGSSYRLHSRRYCRGLGVNCAYEGAGARQTEGFSLPQPARRTASRCSLCFTSRGLGGTSEMGLLKAMPRDRPDQWAITAIKAFLPGGGQRR